MNHPKAHIWKRNFEKEYEKEKRGRDLKNKKTKQKGEKENMQNSFTIKDPKIALVVQKLG